MKSISVEQLKNLQDAGKPINLIDVRTPAEFHAVHVPGACSRPLDTLDCAAILATRSAAKDTAPITILCHSGARARNAAQRFSAIGFEDYLIVEGGTEAYVNAGFSVERGAITVLPLDRQLQIIIGTMVLAGVLLSHVHPAWIWLSGFAGCGLVFAGVSGICPLRTVVALMPWNQGGSDSKKASCTT